MTKAIYGNCIQQTAYALMRGFGDRLLVLKSRSLVWPIHLCVEFDRKCDPWGQNVRTVTHYAFESEHTAEDYAPWWFIGKWRKIDSIKVAERKRFALSMSAGLAFTLGLIAIVLIPWLIAWAFYQPCFMLWWLSHALTSRT